MSRTRWETVARILPPIKPMRSIPAAMKCLIVIPLQERAETPGITLETTGAGSGPRIL